MPERIVILTCETDECQNKGIPIELLTHATDYLCGGCLTPITNVVEKTDGSAETGK